MFQDFKNKHADFKCSKEVYRKTLKDMNISFHHPQSDECSECLLFKEDEKKYLATNETIPDDFINRYEDHKTKANSAIEFYKKDSAQENTEDTKYSSMDLQKVILLPISHQSKMHF